MADPNLPLLLYGAFQAMRARQVPLGLPDYLDAVEALRQGYPWSLDPGRFPTRSDLQRLCRILWARNDAEARLTETLFDSVPRVSDRYRQELDHAFAAPRWADETDNVNPQQDGPPSPARGSGDLDPLEQVSEETPNARVGFATIGQGLALPRLERISGVGGQTYVLEPETILSPRAFAVLWRRFRSRVRTGARIELDVDATIAERCRRGVVARVAFRAPLVSRVSLVVLADTSPSMGPWLPILRALAQSLELSRLDSIRLMYFSNVPRDLVFATPHMAKAVALEDLMSRIRGAPVLILSDGGAARGHTNPRRVRASAMFLGRLTADRRRVVWLNPMPRPRWHGTSAGAAVGRAPGVSFLALDTNGEELVRAVDILRGTKER